VNQSVETSARLLDWVTTYLREKRRFSFQDGDEERVAILAACAYDTRYDDRPRSDQERKAFVLCACKYLLSLSERDKDNMYKLYYQRWKVAERRIVPFWVHSFDIAGQPRQLFSFRNKAQPELVKSSEWPA
jgi:hypothetical protein